MLNMMKNIIIFAILFLIFSSCTKIFNANNDLPFIVKNESSVKLEWVGVYFELNDNQSSKIKAINFIDINSGESTQIQSINLNKLTNGKSGKIKIYAKIEGIVDTLKTGGSNFTKNRLSIQDDLTDKYNKTIIILRNNSQNPSIFDFFTNPAKSD